MSFDNYENKVFSRKAKFGRPPKTASQRRDCVVKLSFTEEEYNLVKQRAELFGYPQLARYIHDYMFDSSRHDMGELKVIPTVNLDAVGQLMGACNNLNQIARRLNVTKEGEDLPLDDVITVVNDVLKLVMICHLSWQGRRDELDVQLLLSGYRNYNFEGVEVVINGPSTVNKKLAEEIKKILNIVRMWRIPQGLSADQFDCRMKIIKSIMLCTVSFLSGNEAQALELLNRASVLSQGDENGHS